MPPPAGLDVTRVEPGVVRWELCDPERRNPVGPAMLDWIADACGALAGEVVVLAGRAGGRPGGVPVFCAGFDLAALAEASRTEPPDASLGRAVAAMRAADATFVADVRGRVIGAGVELVAACDVRVAVHGVDFEIPAARLGVVYRAAGLALLQHVFGPVATRLVLLGERIDAETAAACGAITHLVDRSEIDTTLARIVAGLRARPPLGLAGNRQLLRALVPAVPAGLAEDHERRRSSAFAAAVATRTAAADSRGRPLLSSPPMPIREDIDARLRQARRDRDERTLNVIGMLKNKVLMELKSGSGATETDELWKTVLASYAKQLRKSIPEFEKVGERGKEALAEVEFELGFVEQFLPKRLDEAATEALVRKIVEDQGLAGQGAKATGRVMGLLMKQHKDEVDGDIAKAVVARVLA
jgi:enoyl-CoA hydratase/carnithine racemase/uncharacterized protein YqeY